MIKMADQKTVAIHKLILEFLDKVAKEDDQFGKVYKEMFDLLPQACLYMYKNTVDFKLDIPEPNKVRIVSERGHRDPELTVWADIPSDIYEGYTDTVRYYLSAIIDMDINNLQNGTPDKCCLKETLAVLSKEGPRASNEVKFYLEIRVIHGEFKLCITQLTKREGKLNSEQETYKCDLDQEIIDKFIDEYLELVGEKLTV